MQTQDGALILTEIEMACLMQASAIEKAAHLGINHLTGFTRPGLSEARKELQAAGLLGPDKLITHQNRALFDAALRPERLLVVVRDLPGQGSQELTFLVRQGVFILHSLPAEKVHRLEPIAQPEQIAGLLKTLFPLGDAQVGERFDISGALLEKLFKLIDSGDDEAAQKSSETLPCPAGEMELLLLAVKNRTISGSLALLNLQPGGQVRDGYSLAVLASEQSAWFFHAPTAGGDLLVAQRNGALFFNILDAFSQRLLDGTMFDEPLDNSKIVSFSLSADEFAFCFEVLQRNDIARSLLETVLSDALAGQTEFERRLRMAGDRLFARGWSRPGRDGKPVLVLRLAAAISAIASYEFVLQVNIVRPTLAANATVHVIPNQSFTSVLRPGPDVYVLEHGHGSMLPVYLANLFPDFGQTEAFLSVADQTLAYSVLAEAVEKNDRTESAKILKQAGLKTETTGLLAQDLAEAIYRGTFIRINANSHASQDEINAAIKPLLLLLKGPQRSWLYNFNPVDEKGSLTLVQKREVLTRQLLAFTA